MTILTDLVREKAESSDLYSKENIVGTVTQVGGIPTGAIVERGSNSDGEWTRYADGTQMEWTSFTVDTAGSWAATAGVWNRLNATTLGVPPISSNYAAGSLLRLHGRTLGGGGGRMPMIYGGRLNENIIVQRIINQNSDNSNTHVSQHLVGTFFMIVRWF